MCKAKERVDGESSLKERMAPSRRYKPRKETVGKRLSSGDERFADLFAKLARSGDNRDITPSQSCAGDAARCWCGRGFLEELPGFGTESGVLTRRPVEVDYRTGAKNAGRWLLTALNSASGEQKDLSADAMPFV
ncbi:hypothetical protein V8E53_015852 [Lactarius tabidus]